MGLDVHKKTISYCVKDATGEIIDAGKVDATRTELSGWAEALPGEWHGALEATSFTGWIYDHLEPYAVELAVAHPAMLEAITRAKKKNDRLDAEKICDLLRCNLLPRCYMAPPEIRELRRVRRFRNLLVRQAVRMKNRSSGLLMEIGEEHIKSWLHGKRYFYELLDSLQHTPESALELMALDVKGGAKVDHCGGVKLYQPVVGARVSESGGVGGVQEGGVAARLRVFLLCSRR